MHKLNWTYAYTHIKYIIRSHTAVSASNQSTCMLATGVLWRGLRWSVRFVYASTPL